MQEIAIHQKVTAKDTEIIKAMVQSLYWVSGAYYREKMDEWRDAYQHICDDEAFDLLQNELDKWFNKGQGE